MKSALAPVLALALLLSGCDLISQRLGIEDPQQKEAKADAEGKAVGSACRQSGRAIEDCYSVYRWLPKASIFAGWREMNDYMQSNNLGIVEPKLPPPPGPNDGKKKAATTEGKSDEKTASKSDSADSAKSEAKTDAKADAKAETKGEGKGEKKTGEPTDAKKDAKPASKG